MNASMSGHGIYCYTPSHEHAYLLVQNAFLSPDHILGLRFVNPLRTQRTTHGQQEGRATRSLQHMLQDSLIDRWLHRSGPLQHHAASNDDDQLPTLIKAQPSPTSKLPIVWFCTHQEGSPNRHKHASSELAAADKVRS